MTPFVKFSLGNKKIPMILLILWVSTIIPTESRTVRLMPLLLFCISCFFRKSFWIRKRKRYSFFCFLLVISSAFIHGVLPAKDLFIILSMLMALQYMGQQRLFNCSNDIYMYCIYVIIPISIASYFIKEGVEYIPGKDLTINLFGGHTTKHGTAIVGYLLFVISGYNLYRHSLNKKINLLCFFLSIYITFFSGSRSCLLALVATLLFYLINLNRVGIFKSVLFLTLVIILSFYLESFKYYTSFIREDSLIGKIIKIENFAQYGVTSGRAWLWNYHWDKFVESDYIGSGREFVDFGVGDYVPDTNKIAPAGSESTYTSYLACYGILGIVLLVIFFSLFYQALRRNNKMGACIMFCAIYNTMLGCNFTDPSTPITFLVYLLYFSSFKPITNAHHIFPPTS